MNEYGRKINFAAGPSALPLPVLETLRDELVNFRDNGLSLMELTHRSNTFTDLLTETKTRLKKLLGVGDDYEILFLQGGASLQFSMIPMNLATKDDLTYYTLTGNFAKKSYEEGVKWSKAEVLTTSENDNYSFIPEIDKNKIDKNAKYVHITVNNTIYGTMYNTLPDTNGVPLVGDVSSIILGKNYDYNKFALFYAGAQKNLGIAGLTVVGINKKYLKTEKNNNIPIMLDYYIHAKNDSLYNTAPTFAIYVLGEVLKYLETIGTVDDIEKINVEKANLLYDVIDNSKLYHGYSDKNSRSIMNVVWTTKDEELDKKFIEEAKIAGLINLKGHRVLGGIRASIYNAKTLEETKVLRDFMLSFEKNNK